MKCILILFALLSIWQSVEGKKARVGKKKKKSDVSFPLFFVACIFCLTFVPLIGYFLYNVWRDPLTPTLVKNGTEMMREKTMGFLSKRKVREDSEDKEE